MPNYKNLEILADKLLEIEEAVFSLDCYYLTKSQGCYHGNFYVNDHQENVNFCGTSACAIGHAAFMKEFPLEETDFDFLEQVEKYKLDFISFQNRVFNVKEPTLFGFLFGKNWKKTELGNTPEGTSDRIKFYLKNKEKINEYLKNHNLYSLDSYFEKIWNIDYEWTNEFQEFITKQIQ